MQAQPNGGAAPNCDGCGSPRVVAMDAHGWPLCMRCRANHIGVDEGEARAAMALVRVVVLEAVEHAFVNIDDLRREVEDALEEAGRGRRSMGAVATIEETDDAYRGLASFDRLDENGGLPYEAGE